MVSGSGERISAYEIPDGQMAAGSTLGAPKATVLIKATGAIEKLYATETGKDVFGTLVLHHWDEVTGIPLVPMPGKFVVHPDHQEHVFELSNGLTVYEDIFMLSGKPEGPDLHTVDPPAAYYTVQIQNDGSEELNVATYASVELRGNYGGLTRARYDKGHHAFVVHSHVEPSVVRFAACSTAPASYEVTLDSAKTSSVQFPGDLSNTVIETADDPIGIFHLRHRLTPGKTASFYVVLTFSLEGEDNVGQVLHLLPDASRALARTRAYYDDVLCRSVLVTPDPEVNRGVLWAKANILRCQSLTAQGWCFVNDPTRSNNSVARDTAWFAFGADFITPQFVRESLLWYADHLERSGMVVEYFDIRDGTTADYKLNINDDTPLLILALWHHYNITGDRDFLEYVYPKALRMANYILSQRNEQGLVWCTADGTADWGIVGWRNVIEGYRLSGATTEVNSECYAALKTVATMAQHLEREEDARAFRDHADDLRSAINEHLLDKKRGLYYLNIDLDGTPRTDVTCDLVFPVMFEVADHDTAANIIQRLSTPEFWTEAGLHTVPRNDINYTPSGGYGLRGGVWSGPTFWFAFAAAPFSPEFMAYALSVSFAHYSQDPHRNNTVPGQFCEWLHGETLTNQGMMLSPWFAPKYLWAAIQGAGGLDVTVDPPKIAVRPSRDWKWMGVRNIQLRGRQVAWFVVRAEDLVMYVNHQIADVDPDRIYDEDISQYAHASGESVVLIALRRPDRVVVFVGNTRDRTVTTALQLRDAQLEGHYRIRAYNSLRSEWIERPAVGPDEIAQGIPFQIDRHGFAVVEFYLET